jgi:hypothetical protein
MKSLNLEEYVSVLVEQEVDLSLLSCLEEDELEVRPLHHYES